MSAQPKGTIFSAEPWCGAATVQLTERGVRARRGQEKHREGQGLIYLLPPQAGKAVRAAAASQGQGAGRGQREAVRHKHKGAQGWGCARGPGNPGSPAPILALAEVLWSARPWANGFMCSVCLPCRDRDVGNPLMATLVQGCTSGNQGNELSRSLPVLFTLLLYLSELGEHHLCKAAAGSASMWSIPHPELVQSCSMWTMPRAVSTCLCPQLAATFALCLVKPASGLQVAQDQQWVCHGPGQVLPCGGAGTFTWLLMHGTCIPSTSPRLSGPGQLVQGL